MELGGASLFSLEEGIYDVAGDKTFYPVREEDPPRPGALRVTVRPFLLITAGSITLLDTGLGSFAPTGWGELYENLQAHGVEPEDVSRVVLTHLHRDHAGGVVFEEDGLWRLAFPGAEYVVQRAEWEYALAHPGRGYPKPVLEALARSDQLRLLEGDVLLEEHLQVELIGGHTPGHQAVWIRGEHTSALLAGDVVGSLAGLERRFRAKYDWDPEGAYAWRSALLDRLRAHPDTIVLFYHGLRPVAARLRFHAGPKERLWEGVEL